MFKKYFGDMGFWRIALKLAFPVAMQNLLTSSFILVDIILLEIEFGCILEFITYACAICIIQG